MRQRRGGRYRVLVKNSLTTCGLQGKEPALYGRGREARAESDDPRDLEDMAHADGCYCGGAEGARGSILYNILLKSEGQGAPQAPHASRSPRLAASMHACACGATRQVCLRSPHATCKAASAVLVKTLKFVKNVPCFRELPVDDQHALVRHSWAPLLVLGMAQDRIDFETLETPEPSMLQRILTGGARGQREGVRAHPGVALADVQSIKMFLSKCWALDISTKEYAYLKGAILFNPGEHRFPQIHRPQDKWINCLLIKKLVVIVVVEVTGLMD